MPSESRFAAVDVGSNSIKLRIATRFGAAGSWRWSVLHDEVVITGLGRGLTANRRLDPLATSATLDVLRQFARASAAHGCAGVAAVGTQCLREAEDGADFAAAVHRDTGLFLEIISGQDEARLAYLGACSELPPDSIDMPLAVLDVGGRSTEFGFGRRGFLEQSVSFAVGVLGVTERFLRDDPTTVAEVAAAHAEVSGRLAELTDRGEVPVLIGIGATPATLGAVHLGGPPAGTTAIHGHRLARAEVTRQIELYRRLSVAERRHLPGLHPERATVILAGAILVGAAMDRLGCEELRVGIHGLRQGLLRDRFEGAAT